MIRNLVFDVGGVLLEYRWQDMFRQQGLSEEEIGKLEQVLFRDEIWAWKLDTGAITVAQAHCGIPGKRGATSGGSNLVFGAYRGNVGAETGDLAAGGGSERKGLPYLSFV